MEGFRPLMLPGHLHTGQPCPVCMAPHFPFCPPPPPPHPHHRFVANHHIQQFHQRPTFIQGDHIFTEPRFRPPPIATEAPMVPQRPYYPQGFPSHVVEEHHHRPHLPLPLQDHNQFQPGGDLRFNTMMMPQQGVNNRMVNSERNMASFQQQRIQIGKDDRLVVQDSVTHAFLQRNNCFNGELDSTKKAEATMRNNLLPGRVAGNYSEWSHGRQAFPSEASQAMEASRNMHMEANIHSSSGHCVAGAPKNQGLLEGQPDIQFINSDKEGFCTQKDGEFQKHGLKRKQPMSREEELLIEKGLLDDEQNPTAQKFSHQNELVVQRNRGVGGIHESKIPDSPEKMMSSWPSENFSGRGWQTFASQQVSQTGNRICRPEFQEGRQDNDILLQRQNKEILLQRQYEEWEAEEKRMEALKRAEILAKEIQQREETSRNMGNLQSSQLSDSNMEQLLIVKRNQDNMSSEDTYSRFKTSMNEHNLPQKTSISSYSSQMSHQPQQPNYYSDLQLSNHDHELHQISIQHGKQGEQFDHQRQNIPQKPYFPEQPFSIALQGQSREGFLQQRRDSPNPIQSYEDYWLQNGPGQRKKENATNIAHEVGQWHETNYQPLQSYEQKTHQYKQSIDSKNTQSLVHASAHRANVAENAHQARLAENAHLSGHYQTGFTIGHGGIPPLPPVSIDPPPPCSPPPPLPPSDYPTENMPPLPSSPISSTLLATSHFTMHGSSGNQQHYQFQQDQNLLSRNQGYGSQDPGHPQHMVDSHHQTQLQQPHPSQQFERLKTIDAVSIFRNPGRFTRPDRFVVILRGLPGSGKSYLAKALRDVEVMNGGSAPRIHSMDDYFMSEVEKVEELEMSASSLRSKKKIVKKVMEYCYEPEMEEAYRASMLKAFRKTLEEGMFKFIIVDDRNVLIADFAQFWAIAKRSGYEVYVLEAPYTDVKGCAARNVHNFTEEQVKSMADHWEPTPLLYLKLDVSLLFRGDDLNTQDIIEVEMDADDIEQEEEDFQSSKEKSFGTSADSAENSTWGDRWEDKSEPATESEVLPVAKRLMKDHSLGRESTKKSNDNALSGLMTTYGKKDKFVHWSDNEGNSGSKLGFTLASQKGRSLIIGPGPGYNGISNPVMAEDDKRLEGELRKTNKFTEQLRAEQETFKAVLARRRQRISAVDEDEED